jgi:hypothetical protein
VDFAIEYDFYTGRTEDAQKDFAVNRVSFMKANVPELNGFALFDEVNKVHIDFPRGW